MNICNIPEHKNTQSLLNIAGAKLTERARVNAKLERENAEQERVNAEQERVNAEQKEIIAEHKKTIAEEKELIKELEMTLEEIKTIIEKTYKNNTSFTSVMTRTFNMKYTKANALEKAEELGMLVRYKDGYGAKLTELGERWCTMKGETIRFKDTSHKHIIATKYMLEYEENRRIARACGVL